MRGRRAGRRTARRTTRRRRVVRGPARRRSRRVYRRRRRRRRLLFGGAVLLAAGGAAYAGVKLAQKDADRIQEHTGVPPEELSDEDLQGAMDELGIEGMEMTDEDYAALDAEPDTAPEPSYLEELEKLAALRDQGIISDEDFETKKNQLLGL